MSKNHLFVYMNVFIVLLLIFYLYFIVRDQIKLCRLMGMINYADFKKANSPCISMVDKIPSVVK